MYFYHREHGKYVRYDDKSNDYRIRDGRGIRSLQHFRTPCFATDPKTQDAIPNGFTHTAVAVLDTGECYSGSCSPWYGRDTYDRKRGYKISVGVALKKANLAVDSADFTVDHDVWGNDLRDIIRKTLDIPGKEVS